MLWNSKWKFNKKNVVRRKNIKNNNKSARSLLVVNQNPEHWKKIGNKRTVSDAESYKEALISDSNKENLTIKYFLWKFCKYKKQLFQEEPRIKQLEKLKQDISINESSQHKPNEMHNHAIF